MKKGDIRLQEIYNYLKSFIDDNGFPPSVREIGEKFSIKSTSTVHYYLEKLREQGLISQDGNKKRAFTVTQTRSLTNYVPLVGNVSAGKGILAVENVEGEFPLPHDIFMGKDLFMLRVEGDSMIEAGIHDGDFVIVHSQNSADLNEIVVALWQDKATVKRLHATSPNLVLHPENSSMEDIVITPDENPSIIGKVIGCIKKF
ncbi:MAG: transcriptional repressor LexA [Clostridiales bacterium]|nr:transcriptional repressor LexA [Clostridiales bacterium]